MFVQVITAKVGDARAIERAMARWDDERRPAATGFLGATSGISAQGDFIAVARFESEELARQNSDSPEQTAWWNELSKGFAGEPAFHDCTEVEVYGDGGSDDAGFVQIMQGVALDKQAVKNMAKEFEAMMSEARPDLIGSLTAWDGDFYTDVVYFTNEAEARANEAKPLPPEVQEGFERWRSVAGDIRYFDLKEPRIVGA